MSTGPCKTCNSAGWRFFEEHGCRLRNHLARAASLVTTDRGVLASCLAWPEFQKRWRAGQWPEFLVHGVHI